MGKFYDTTELRGKTLKKFNTLIDEMNLYFDKINMQDYYKNGKTFLLSYLNDNIRLVEEFSLKHVSKRRRITNFWSVTWYRIKKGKIFHFIFSIPRIIINAIRDFRMSLSFVYHLKNKNF